MATRAPALSTAANELAVEPNVYRVHTCRLATVLYDHKSSQQGSLLSRAHVCPLLRRYTAQFLSRRKGPKRFPLLYSTSAQQHRRTLKGTWRNKDLCLPNDSLRY